MQDQTVATLDTTVDRDNSSLGAAKRHTLRFPSVEIPPGKLAVTTVTHTLPEILSGYDVVSIAMWRIIALSRSFDSHEALTDPVY